MRTAAVCALAFFFAAPLRAGKLDLNIYASAPVPRVAPADGALPWAQHWVPGNPRDLRGESLGVQYLSHAGYAGLGVAGLIGSVASGGVAPAVGFGLIALYHLWQGFELHRRPA
ncbi:MAG: hypothetical protein KGL74_05530 [Elusimicrobia bacterium]|nr:hypothetical protein [Elusimicrobiota bacterium]MDE2510563.1 hypothetical protein [Elusimicrobiota bacterium]